MQQWNLVRNDVLMGTLTYIKTDQPFLFCGFEPTEAFTEIAPLFAAELRSLNADEMEQWEQDYERINDLRLSLVAPDGSARIDEFILHIDGNEAWFRA